MICRKCGKKILVFDGRIKYCAECNAYTGEKIFKTPCALCGEMVINYGRQRKELHRECIIDDIYDTLYSGERLTHAQYQRANNYEISVMEIKRAVREDMRGRVKY